MSIPPPGLGGGVSRAGPPPGFAGGGALGVGPGGISAPPSSVAAGSGGRDVVSPGVLGLGQATAAGGLGSGRHATQTDGAGTAVIVRAQIVFLLTTLTEDTYEKSAAEIRTLASSNGPEMYHHFLRRCSVVANPILSILIQHSTQYKDDPAAPPPSIPSSGQAALAWRLLVTEAVRASRDVSLAPHFTLIMLSHTPSTPLPLPSIRIFGLPPAYIFSLLAYSLASPQVLPPNHQSADMTQALLQQTFQPTMELLRTGGVPFWSTGPLIGAQAFTDDLSPQEARTLILALYPRATSSGSNTGNPSRPPTPTNPTAPHPSPLSSPQRAALLGSLAVKFSSPAIILQTLTALSPGGPPRSPGSIPLEDILFELGEGLTQDEGTVEAVVVRWWGPYLPIEQQQEDASRAVTEEACRTVRGLFEGLREGRAVDVHGVVKGLTCIPSISFADVVRSFDLPTDLTANPPSMSFFVTLLLSPPQNPIPPIAGLIPASPYNAPWDNMLTLLHIIWRLTSVSPDAIPLFTMPNGASPAAFARIIEPPRSADAWSKTARQQAMDLQGAGLWNTLGLVQILVHGIRIGEGEVQGIGQEEAAEIGRMASERLDRAAVIAPELALIAFEKLPKPLPAPVQAQHTRLLAVYLSSPPENVTSSQLVFHQMLQDDLDNLLAVLLEFYAENEDNLGRIMDIANEIEILSSLIASENTHFALDVATQASQKERINLEMWLADGIAVKGHEFLESIFEFVEHKIRLEMDHQHAPESVPALKHTLTADTYSIFIRVVRNAEGLEREDIMRFKTLRTDILIQHPRLLNLFPGSKEEQGFTFAKYPKEVGAHAEELFQRMYSEHIKIDNVIEQLEQWKKSDEPAEQEIFASAMHSLFDEYRFVKAYPIKELTMTGILFGAIIDSRLVKDTAAFVATRYVLDACKSPPTPPHDALYQFGINALSVLRPSLVDFPGLCRELIEIPTLHEQHPSLVSEIMDALQEREELDMQGGVKLAFPALKLPILVEEGEDEFREPDPKKRDAIMFIINNIAPSNWSAKSQDLQRLFEDQWSRWFAHYFIDVRVALEANRHEIYLQILDALASPVLERHILWETYRKARDLLNSEATMNSASERTTLKTIAMWLGKITLARNKPIRMKELSVKDLLLQGYDNKRLIVAIPFVCNLLTSCNESTVFHPPNPWLVAVLGLLVEFYNGGDIRLNLKFEIEVLFSKLGVALETIRPTDLLRTRKPIAPAQQDVPDRLDAEYRRALDDMRNGSQRHVEPTVNEAFARMQQQQSEASIAQAAEEFNARVDELVAQLPSVLHFDEEYPIFTAPTLQRIVIHSVARAIKEIIIPVVERSVTIAGISSRDLVQKDFGTEGDPNKMRQAAHLMVQNLAGNLALVTCKEALRTSMISNIRNMLGQNGFTEESMPDGPLTGIVNDNLDAACKIIKKAAMEKAGTDIDVNLAPQYAARRAHRDANARSQQPFFDGASFGVAISHSALPDPLRLRTGGLSAAQLRVYEDFAEPARLPAVPAGAGGDYAQYYHGDMLEGKRGPTPGAASLFPGTDFDDSGPLTPAALPTQAAIDKFSEIIADMEKYIAASAPGMSFSSLSDDVRHAIRMPAQIAVQAANKDQVTLILSQRVVQMLYKSSVSLGREIYTLMLQQLCDVAPKVNTEVRQWLVYAEDPRKLNVPVTSLLIRAGFINVPDLDAQLAQRLMQNYSPEMQDYVAGLIRDCSLNERSLVSRNAFAQSLAALLKARDMQRAAPPVEHLLEDLRIGPSRSRSTDISNGQDETPGIDEDRLTLYFLDWVRVYTTSPRPEHSFIPYVAFLTKEGILNGDDISTSWYRIAINCAVDLDSSKLNEPEPTFNGTDALAKLIVLIVKNHGDRKDLTNTEAPRRAVYYFTKMMTIVAYSLIERANKEDSTFNQRAWTRFYTTMLSELASLQEQLIFRDIYVGCIKALANSLGLIQPFYAPKFAFGWLSVVSHRYFMSKLLSMPRDDGWPEYHRCLMWLLRFLSPFLKRGEMDAGAKSVYKATLKLLLVVLHDFPDFLVEYYHTLSTAIPTHCVQLRNIVLSAFPPAQAPLPDWYRRLDQLVPDMQHIPVVRQDYIHSLEGGSVKTAIDQYVRTGMPQLQAIVSELKNRIAIKSMEDEGPVISWNHTLLNAAVFYIGTLAVERSSVRLGSVEYDSDAPEVSLLTSLAFALDAEGQYYLLSVIADQLRYPSAHTLWFLSFMLFLFSTSTRTDAPAGAQELPERIARVLVERVVVRKPHPWGLVVCFVELLNNETYEFWKQPFVNSEEAIYMIFVKAHAGFLSARNQQQQVQAFHTPVQGQQQAVGQ